MADGVNRIVPAAISPEPIPAHGRDRKKREPPERRHSSAKVTNADPKAARQTSHDDAAPQDGQDKGKRLDIKA